MRRVPKVAVPLLLTAVVACSPPASDAGAARFDLLFQETGRVSFQEDPTDPITGIAFLKARPRGGYLLVDEIADEVHVFDGAGRLERVLGGEGDGPGELDAPTAAVELLDGRVLVTQRSNRRLTTYGPDGTATVSTVPGRYAQWLHDSGRGLVVGIGSREDRFAITTYDGDSLASFGALEPEVNRIPFWIYYARMSAAVFGDRVAVNTSFYPTIRLFTLDGDSVGTIDATPRDWQPAGEPPLSRARTPDEQEAIKSWSSGFTIVAGLAGLEGGQLVVQYGRFAPTEREVYAVEARTIDVFSAAGEKLARSVPLAAPVLGGGSELLVLVGEPPESWTVARYRWTGPER